jgi:ubiquinone biosynthesis protein UbiJ
MPATPAWLAAVEALLNRGIHGSFEAAALARRLEGTVLEVDLEGVAAVRVHVAAGRIGLQRAHPPADANPPADAAISGSPLALLQLARGGRDGAQRPGSSAKATIRGDAEIANAYRQLMVSARPDLEEELARRVGDLPARRLAGFARSALSWARSTRRTAFENVAEYLQEESRDLVGRRELEEFVRGVDALRESADRVAARLARLDARLKGP